jgi:hypothetical protein
MRGRGEDGQEGWGLASSTTIVLNCNTHLLVEEPAAAEPPASFAFCPWCTDMARLSSCPGLSLVLISSNSALALDRTERG